MASRRTLVGISAVVWLAAGLMVLRFGVQEYPSHLSALLVALTLIVFVPFGMMFQKMTVKNRRRIVRMGTDDNNPLSFFTPKTYAIIAFMMALGASLRACDAVPRFFIAFFYVGLGSALFLAGRRYAENFIRYGRYESADAHEPADEKTVGAAV